MTVVETPLVTSWLRASQIFAHKVTKSRRHEDGDFTSWKFAMTSRNPKFEDETAVEPSSGDGPLGEKFVRREMDLTQRINGTPVEDTTKEFVIEKKHNAKN